MPTPLPLMGPVRQLVLFGGSFDPPHRAHLLFARFVLDRLSGSSLLMVPAARSPHKSAGPRATPEQRIEMLRLGLGDVGLSGPDADPGQHSRVGIWTEEVDRAEAGEPSYWVDTLRAARSLVGPQTELRFVIGSDQVAAFARWREPHEILRLAAPVVLVRGSDQRRGQVDEQMARDVVSALDAVGPSSTDRIVWSEAERSALAGGVMLGQPLTPMSSTLVRELLRNDNASSKLDEALTPSVLSFIRRLELYRD